MRRRQFVLGFGTIAAGSAAAVGSGAFSSVEAERDIAVEVAEDSDAFLALVSTSECAVEENGTLALDLSPSNPTDAGGEGVNANATTIIDDGFAIENQGTQDVEIGFEDDDGEFTQELSLGDPQSDDLLVDIDPNDEPVVLEPGEQVSYEITVNTREGTTPGDNIDETITVIAEATE